MGRPPPRLRHEGRVRELGGAKRLGASEDAEEEKRSALRDAPRGASESSFSPPSPLRVYAQLHDAAESYTADELFAIYKRLCALAGVEWRRVARGVFGAAICEAALEKAKLSRLVRGVLERARSAVTLDGAHAKSPRWARSADPPRLL